MKILRTPQTLYQVIADFGPYGIGNVTEGRDNIEAAADGLVDFLEDHHDQSARVLRLDFDVETNMPEAFSDVTEDCLTIIRDRCEARGFDASDYEVSA